MKTAGGMLGIRVLLVLSAAVAAGGTAVLAGPRAGLLLLIGLAIGLVLEGLRFGFAGPWRALIERRDGRGLNAQLLAIALTAVVAMPLLATAPGELAGAHGPVGLAMIGGALLFGACMQLVFGCGSGTLVNAGSGNLIGLVALPLFVLGSFLGSLHLAWWTDLASLPVISLGDVLGDPGGLVLTLGALAVTALLVARRAAPGLRLPQGRLLAAAALLAALALANLVVAGQPWGIVYGLGLWGAKVAQAGGIDLVAGSAFWASPANAERLRESVLTDVTSLTNLGLIAGAFIAVRWRRQVAAQVAPLPWRMWAVIPGAALLMGYSSRLAFGCNVGAFFSGISTGSLHGWAWFAAAFVGSILGLRLMRHLQPAGRQAGAG